MFRNLLLLTIFAATAYGQSPTHYQNDFESTDLGRPPQELMIIDGGFAVVEEGGNRFLELPGAPLDSFSLLFGPTEKDNRRVSARIYGTLKGRRFPTFSVGLGGVGGYKLQVSPGKKELELYKGDTVKTSVPFLWKSGQWTRMSLAVKQKKPGQWTVEGRIWDDGAREPVDATLTWLEVEQPPAGRASVGGSPYATTPIRYDDLATAPAQ